MDLQLVKQLFTTLYSDVNGYVISSQARHKLPISDKSHTYGEVVPESFFEMINYVKPKPKEIFYDLGSGTGKAVILAALLFDFQSCFGIETLLELYKVAQTVLTRFNHEVVPALQKKVVSTVEFEQADFLDYDISDGDIFFAHSTCFSPELMVQLTKKLESIKEGARVITVTKVIDSPHFACLKTQDYLLGWGKVTINFYQKVD